MRIAIIADSHFSRDQEMTCGRRHTGMAAVILRRAVFRLNRLIKPDVTILLGDLINNGNGTQATEDLQLVLEQIQLCKSPVIALPGNHDGDPENFYKVFPRPPAILELGNVRFVNNIDAERPGYNAFRNAEGLELLRQARQNWPGQIVSLQHVPILPTGKSACPYHYENDLEILQEFRNQGVALAISAHYHPGVSDVSQDGTTFVVAPALCEAPLNLLLVELENKRCSSTLHPLQMPTELQLSDTHIHTHFAYCQENMQTARLFSAAKLFGIKDFCLTEHSGHLYCSREHYAAAQTELLPMKPEERRLENYFAEMLQAGQPPQRIGLEIDCRADGSMLLDQAGWDRAGFRIGALHALPSLCRPKPQIHNVADEFLALNAAFLKHGFDSLAHPFRVFRRAGMPIPESLFQPMVKLLKENRTAAEINFHTNEPPLEFFQLCLEAGVKITLGSDAHHLYEIGDLALHLDFLQQCGFNGNLNDILLLLPE